MFYVMGLPEEQESDLSRRVFHISPLCMLGKDDPKWEVVDWEYVKDRFLHPCPRCVLGVPWSDKLGRPPE